MRDNYRKMFQIRASDIAAHFGMELNINHGSRYNGISYAATFSRAGMRWEFRDISPMTVFHSVAAFGDGLRAAERLLECGLPLTAKGSV